MPNLDKIYLIAEKKQLMQASIYSWTRRIQTLGPQESLRIAVLRVASFRIDGCKSDNVSRVFEVGNIAKYNFHLKHQWVTD